MFAATKEIYLAPTSSWYNFNAKNMEIIVFGESGSAVTRKLKCPNNPTNTTKGLWHDIQAQGVETCNDVVSRFGE